MTEIDMDAVIAELRKPYGWTKGDYGPYWDANGAVCLRGACARVAGLELDTDADLSVIDGLFAEPIRENFIERCGTLSSTAVPWVPEFNDHPDTTLDDVILVCEKARARMGEVA